MSWMHWRDASLKRMTDGELDEFRQLLDVLTRNDRFGEDPGRWEDLHDRIASARLESDERNLQLALF